MDSRIGIVLIAVGAVIMALSMLRSRAVRGALPFVDRSTRDGVRHLLRVHGALIAFFLIGYVVMVLAVLRDWPIVGNTLVGLIFAGGAVFVYLGLSIQSRLVGELLQTMGKLIPMCASCRKIRLPDADPAHASSWQPVEIRFSGASDSIFSHGICPECEAKIEREHVPASQ